MPTNSLGPNMTGFSVPLNVEDKLELGRKALELDESASGLVRQLIKKFLAGEITLAIALLAWSGIGSHLPEFQSQSLQTVVRRVRRGGRRNESDVIESLYAALEASEVAAA